MTMARADRISSAVFFLMGISMAVGGWTMDRLEIRQIHPASIPGLVPMILGVLLAGCAVGLFLSAKSGTEMGDEPAFQGGVWGRLLLTGILSVVYALGLVGTLPFFWATALYVTAFAAIFGLEGKDTPRAKLLTIGFSIVFGLLVALATSALFEHIFLVRLP